MKSVALWEGKHLVPKLGLTERFIEVNCFLWFYRGIADRVESTQLLRQLGVLGAFFVQVHLIVATTFSRRKSLIPLIRARGPAMRTCI